MPAKYLDHRQDLLHGLFDSRKYALQEQNERFWSLQFIIGHESFQFSKWFPFFVS